VRTARAGIDVARLLLDHDDSPRSSATLAAIRALSRWPTVVMDGFFDYYAAWLKTRGRNTRTRPLPHWVQNDYCPGPVSRATLVLGSLSAPVNRGFTVTVRRETHPSNRALHAQWSGRHPTRYGITTSGGASVYREQVGRFTRTVPPVNPSTSHAEFRRRVRTYCSSRIWLDAERSIWLNTAFVQAGSEPWSRFAGG